MKVMYDEQKKEWIELPPDSKEGMYIDGKLKIKLDSIKSILKKNWDAPFMIDGLEGSGKITLGLTCAWYLSDTKFTKENICKSAKNAISKLGSFPDESVLLIDEGDLMFSSKEVFNTEQQRLIKLLKVIRYKKMVLIIIAPSFFDLNKGISVRRSRFLLHVYTDPKMNRGRYAYFGEKKKKMLYEIGKKNFGSYYKPSADFVGRFTDFNPLGEDYHEVKDEIVNGLIDETKIDKPKSKNDYLVEFIAKFKENCPEVSHETIIRGFNTSRSTYYRLLRGGVKVSVPNSKDI